MRNCILLAVFVGCVTVFTYAQSGRNPPSKQADRIEIVKTDWPLLKSAQAAVPVAISSILGKIRLDQPLFIQSIGESDGSCSVRIFTIPASEFGGTLEANTGGDRKLAETKVTGRGVSTTLSRGFQSVERTPADEAVLSAVVYLNGLGALADQLRLQVRPQSNGEFNVEVVAFPLKPGAFTTVVVSQTGIQLRPGM